MCVLAAAPAQADTTQSPAGSTTATADAGATVPADGTAGTAADPGDGTDTSAGTTATTPAEEPAPDLAAPVAEEPADLVPVTAPPLRVVYAPLCGATGDIVFEVPRADPDVVEYRHGEEVLTPGRHTTADSSFVATPVVTDARYVLANPEDYFGLNLPVASCMPTDIPVTAPPLRLISAPMCDEPGRVVYEVPRADPDVVEYRLGDEVLTPGRHTTDQTYFLVTPVVTDARYVLANPDDFFGISAPIASCIPSTDTASPVTRPPSQDADPTDEDLPPTGSSTAPILVIAAALLAAGGATVWFRRTRTR